MQKTNDEIIDAITFIAEADKCQEGISTAVWYVSWILYGLRSHEVEEVYIDHVRMRAIDANQKAVINAQDQIELINEL